MLPLQARLVKSDVPVFSDILHSLFPGLEKAMPRDAEA